MFLLRLKSREALIERLLNEADKFLKRVEITKEIKFKKS
jgi:hypothetical protein